MKLRLGSDARMYGRGASLLAVRTLAGRDGTTNKNLIKSFINKGEINK